MLYREAGQFKTNYIADQAVFPIRQDRVGIFVILLIAFVGIPLLDNTYFQQAVMIPFLI
jgi:branched-chain amino acid transport system permease protein